MAGGCYSGECAGCLTISSLSWSPVSKKLSRLFTFTLHRVRRQLTAHERCIFGSEFILLFELKKFWSWRWIQKNQQIFISLNCLCAECASIVRSQRADKRFGTKFGNFALPFIVLRICSREPVKRFRRVTTDWWKPPRIKVLLAIFSLSLFFKLWIGAIRACQCLFLESSECVTLSVRNFGQRISTELLCQVLASAQAVAACVQQFFFLKLHFLLTFWFRKSLPDPRLVSRKPDTFRAKSFCSICFSSSTNRSITILIVLYP